MQPEHPPPSSTTTPPFATEPSAFAQTAPQTLADGKRFAPPLGSRIQVLWRITYDDAEPVVCWWGAVVQDCTRETVGGVVAEYSHCNVHILLYDARDEFEEDVARVAFVARDSLLDLACTNDENKGILDWKLEEAGEESAPHVSLHDVLRNEMEGMQEAGVRENADLEALGSMPAHVQTNITAGYRNFVDGVKEMLEECVRTNPPGYVVTEQDVRQMYARVLAKYKGVSI